jgi:hypothetical protein
MAFLDYDETHSTIEAFAWRQEAVFKAVFKSDA